ncbi:MAG: type II toxin-antitoxin system RelB/DinJ family antitoxin [Lachnospiraceae bacterium]|jgi:DNA-damage-inducible protein J|nr:type II toxin-antitoxin system RelB/DinJ family antitoxin [Lachnospiraceae bacterium]
MMSTIQVRIDKDLKEKSDKLFKDLGTDTTTAIRMFLTQAINKKGFPFTITKNVSTPNPFELLSASAIFSRLENSRNQANLGMSQDANEFIADMRAKYDL